MGEYAINTEYLARFDKLIESGLSNFHVILSQQKNYCQHEDENENNRNM